MRVFPNQYRKKNYLGGLEAKPRAKKPDLLVKEGVSDGIGTHDVLFAKLVPGCLATLPQGYSRVALFPINGALPGRSKHQGSQDPQYCPACPL